MTAAAGRRSLMGSGVAMLVLAAAAAGEAKATELDGGLLQLCSEFRSYQAELDQINREGRQGLRRPKDHPRELALDAAVDHWCELWHDRLDTITTTPAHTPEGLRAKALVLKIAVEAFAAPGYDETVEQNAAQHELLAWSLANDILGRPA